MNILIISFDADPPYMGGTSTVANVLAKSFIKAGHFCALGYFEKSQHPSEFFKQKIWLNSRNHDAAIAFFQQHSFDIILNHLAVSTDYSFLKKMALGNCKIISAYHNRPMFRPVLVKNILTIYHESSKLLYKLYTIAKIPLIPLLSITSIRKQRLKISEANLYSDRVLLLSDKFFPLWKKMDPKVDVNKLIAIGNPLVFEKGLLVKELDLKEKLVIAVCSVNSQKRADKMLQVWSAIEKNKQLDDWTFEFIGEGEGFFQIKKLAEKLQLKRISFKGYQNPYNYYRRASIMMMTSRFEGWPMVLMEGQQMGVVPISYNSYESITDIITNGENGLIIPNNDINCYVHQLTALMQNKSEIKRLSYNAINSANRFSIEKVTQKYLAMFEALISNN